MNIHSEAHGLPHDRIYPLNAVCEGCKIDLYSVPSQSLNLVRAASCEIGHECVDRRIGTHGASANVRYPAVKCRKSRGR